VLVAAFSAGLHACFEQTAAAVPPGVQCSNFAPLPATDFLVVEANDPSTTTIGSRIIEELNEV
jgi:hypothetical protein